jgi:hypothetical protein
VTIFKLKEDLTFPERNACFGVREIQGRYRILNDTIYFFNTKPVKQEDVTYEFGVIEELEYYTENPYALKLFKNKNDVTGFRYFITKNDLIINSTKRDTIEKRSIWPHR